MWQHYITPKHLHLKALGSKLLLDICLADSRILYFWYVLKSIHRLIIELHALQCLFAMGPDKKQRRGRIISNFTKGETFHLLGQPSTLGGNLIMRSPFLHPSKKASLSPLVWARREYIWTLRRAYLFILKIARMFSIPSSRNRMMSTFLIAYRIRLCFSLFQRRLLSSFSLARNKICLGTHLKEELTNLFWKLTGYCLFPHR